MSSPLQSIRVLGVSYAHIDILVCDTHRASVIGGVPRSTRIPRPRVAGSAAGRRVIQRLHNAAIR